MELPTPELDKMLAVKPESQIIGEFLEWLASEEIVLATWSAFDDVLYPERQTIEQLLAKYYEIDLNKCEQERRAILDSLQGKP